MALRPALSTSCVAAAAGAAGVLELLGKAEPSGVILHSGLEPAAYQALERELAARSTWPVVAIEAPCPRTRESVAMLTSLDRSEAEVALAVAEATVRRAATVNARFVVVRLGEVRELEGEWQRARTRFLRGELDDDDADEWMRDRRFAGERPFDAARRAIDRLVRVAESAGVVLCLKNGRRFIDLPSAHEMELVVAEYRGAPVAPLFDVAAAHLTDVMGFAPMAVTLASFGARAAFAYVGDACGPLGALAPGRGILDVPSVLAKLPKDATLGFSPWSGLAPSEVLEAMSCFAAMER